MKYIELLAKIILGVGICLLFLWITPLMIYPILTVVTIAFIVYSWKFESIWGISISILIGLIFFGIFIGIFSGSFMGLLFASSIASIIIGEMNKLIEFIKMIPKDYLLIFGISFIAIGLIFWKFRWKFRRRSNVGMPIEEFAW